MDYRSMIRPESVFLQLESQLVNGQLVEMRRGMLEIFSMLHTGYAALQHMASTSSILHAKC